METIESPCRLKIKMNVHIRWAIRLDMPSVLDIEARTHEFAWGEGEFLKQLRRRNVIGMIAERGDRVLGYVVYELFRDRLEVLRLGVDPEFGRKGIGTQIADKLKGKLSVNRRTAITTDVRERNLDGLLFLRESGFKAVALHRGWFDDSGEDMIQMRFEV